ncbi:hypothetical protein GJ496_011775 [Pomphorhynchus laevis]|nr:hypothetical protein GJ496_011775 [Pomphorhynchus laevis]
MQCEGESYKELMDEAHVLQSMTVQKRTSSLNNPKNDINRAFSRKIQERNMRAAINMLQRVESEQSVLKLDDVVYDRTVKEMLTDLHPPGTISEEALQMSTSEEEVIYGLPLRDGGPGIRDTTIDTSLEYSRSLRICQPFLTGKSAEECFKEEHSIFKS